jgi:hypothetical protein
MSAAKNIKAIELQLGDNVVQREGHLLEVEKLIKKETEITAFFPGRTLAYKPTSALTVHRYSASDRIRAFRTDLREVEREIRDAESKLSKLKALKKKLEAALGKKPKGASKKKQRKALSSYMKKNYGV